MTLPDSEYDPAHMTDGRWASIIKLEIFYTEFWSDLNADPD
jgi:hypothetical protein